MVKYDIHVMWASGCVIVTGDLFSSISVCSKEDISFHPRFTGTSGLNSDMYGER